MLGACPPLAFARQPVQDVGERFVVHFLVLEDGVRGFGAHEPRVGRVVERGVGVALGDRRVAGRGEGVNRRAARPCGALVLGCDCRITRIDTAVEQLLQLGVDRRPAERVADQRDEGKAGDVPIVEHERVPQRQRRVLVRFRSDRREKVRGALPVGAIAHRHRFTVDCRCSQRVHVPAFTRDCAQSRAGWARPYYRSWERGVAAKLSTRAARADAGFTS